MNFTNISNCTRINCEWNWNFSAQLDKIVNKRLPSNDRKSLGSRLNKRRKTAFHVYAEMEMEMEISKFDLVNGGNVTQVLCAIQQWPWPVNGIFFTFTQSACNLPFYRTKLIHDGSFFLYKILPCPTFLLPPLWTSRQKNGVGINKWPKMAH